MSNYYAAIGSDGTRLVVWGAGDGVREALTDARRCLHGLPAEDRDVALTLQPISETQMVLIAAGMIDWQTLKTKKACTPRGRDMYRFVDERSALEEAGYRPTLCVDHADWSSLTMWVAHDPDDDASFYETLAHIRKIVGEYDCHATETDQLRDSADGRRRQVIVVR